jgi:hypothetical protein
MRNFFCLKSPQKIGNLGKYEIRFKCRNDLEISNLLSFEIFINSSKFQNFEILSFRYLIEIIDFGAWKIN